MKLKLTSRSFIYIAILIIVFYYGVKFIGTLREGLVEMTSKSCRGRKGNRSCFYFCRKQTDSNGDKFKTGTCCKGKCKCGTRQC
jgi:hypothetical protein